MMNELLWHDLLQTVGKMLMDRGYHPWAFSGSEMLEVVRSLASEDAHSIAAQWYQQASPGDEEGLAAVWDMMCQPYR